MTNEEELSKKHRDDLHEMAVALLGSDKIGSRWGAKRLIKAILEATGGQIPEDKSGAAPHIQDIDPEDQKPHTAKQNFKPLAPIQKVTREPASADKLKEELHGYIQRGLKIVTLDDKEWHFTCGVKEDSGNMQQPLQQIVKCAKNIVKR